MDERKEDVSFSHVSVLLQECMEGLAIKPDGIYIDGTCGGAGHSSEIAKRLTTGRLIGIDQDLTAVQVATERLAPFGDRALVVHSNFCNLDSVCRELGIQRIDGFLADLGVSSYQLDTPERGFSYMADAPLDMRMNSRPDEQAFSDKADEAFLTAYDVVNTYSEAELRRVLYEYGEERFAPRIASKIVKAREISPIRTTGELVALIKEAIPAAAREGGHHPAKRSFQAIRIEVNRELDVIRPALEAALDRLNPGGRMAVITFHSLEDRIVKQTFADMASGCTCPKSLPICVCGKKPRVKIISKKPVLPSPEELAVNPRSRSAKLRIAEKL
ncbi:MAG: 16S rRNA (cytosine(1402)-N(4))-methyltransferase RsmH [Ruminococcaceae bacterium]|nr:16S rRNA (cytosine(1402)-N(4))-methyltransferase RsmH [Oscillospiraceae bacterium]